MPPEVPSPERQAPALAGTLAAGLAALCDGDPAPLHALLSTPLGAPPGVIDLSASQGSRLWYTVCTLYGVVPSVPVIRQGAERWPLSLDYPQFEMTGGPPRTLDDPAAFVAGLLPLLRAPPTLQGHRLGLVALRAELLDPEATPPGAPDLAWLDAAVTLLDHHTERPTSVLAGHQTIVAAPDPAALRARYEAVPIDDPVAFQAHLLSAGTSPSRGRRDLSARLLRLPPLR